MRSVGPRWGVAEVLFGAYALVCLAALTWPVFEIVGNRVEPRILGAPLSLVWNVAWVIFSFVALGTYHLATGRRE